MATSIRKIIDEHADRIVEAGRSKRGNPWRLRG